MLWVCPQILLPVREECVGVEQRLFPFQLRPFWGQPGGFLLRIFKEKREDLKSAHTHSHAMYSLLLSPPESKWEIFFVSCRLGVICT